MATAHARACPLCAGPLETFARLRGVPVFCNVLHATRAEALAAPRADLELGLCARCSLVHNSAFDPALVRYAEGYENSLFCSETFRRFAEELVERLVGDHGLADKLVLEVGCGRGEFLALLCRRGRCRGVGLDPSLPTQAEPSTGDPRVRLIAAGFEAAGALLAPERPDAIICRHVLEHLAAPLELLRDLRRLLPECQRSILYLEVPDARATLERGSVFDLIYEHCSYFGAEALDQALARAGFATVSLSSVYGGQFLAAVAHPARPSAPPAVGAGLGALARGFAAELERALARWRGILQSLARQRSRTVLWGAGSKGVTLLNLLADAAECVESCVDQNPNKHGRHVPGTGQPVVAPASLAADPPDTVLIANPLYVAEIEAQLAALGLHPRLLGA